MKKIIVFATALPILLALLLAGCEVEAPETSLDLKAPAGDKLFANYVSIGNSLTAGFMDGGLVMSGQMNSYPRLIANQFGLDMAEFSQPYILSPGVGSSAADEPGNVAGVLHFNGAGISLLDETPAGAVPGLLLALKQPTPYHNLGVPGAVLNDVMNTFDASGGNPFFQFINRSSFLGNDQVDAAGVSPEYQTGSMFWQAVSKGPSLLTMWIGNNDILGAATNGGASVGHPITSTDDFRTGYVTLLQSMAMGLLQRNSYPSTIVVANIPNISDIPYFLPLATFEVAVGAAWPAGYAESDIELVCFPALNEDPGAQLGGEFTLTTAEVAAIDEAVLEFNGIIADAVSAVNVLVVAGNNVANVGLVDANALMASLTVPQKTHFMLLLPCMGMEVAAGATLFSLDGVHPNNQGYGVIANAFIEKINELADTEVPAVDLGTLSWDPTYGVTPAPGKTDQNSAEVDLSNTVHNLFR